MPETICDSNLSPVCIIPTHTAIEKTMNDSNMSTGKIIGTFGPEIIGIIGATALIAGTKRGRGIVIRVAKTIDKIWDKLVVEPYNNEVKHLHAQHDKKDAI